MTTREEYGRLWEYWNDEVPIVVSDVLLVRTVRFERQFVSATADTRVHLRHQVR
jgi:hypothetical protein